MAAPSPSAPDLSRLVDLYEQETFAHRPDEARRLGLHEYDGQLPDLGADAQQARLAFLQRLLAALGEDVQGLPARLLRHALVSERWALTVEREDERDPLFVAALADPSDYLKRDYAPWPERERALAAHLQGIPELLAQARTRLWRELPLPNLETGLEVFAGLREFLEVDLPMALQRQAQRSSQLETVRAGAIAAVQQHEQFLREERLPVATPEFALGRRGFEGLLHEGEGVGVPLSRLVDAAQRDLERNRQQLRELVQVLAPGRTPAEVVQGISLDHPPAEGLLPTTRALVDELAGFVARHRFVGLPEHTPPEVAETPPFMRWSFASLDTPGLLCGDPLPCIYFVTAPAVSWEQDRAQQWLRTLNRHSLRLISCHETFPGHFLHYLHARRAPSRLLRLLARSTHFWEGWAHYAEELMAELGYRAYDPRVRVMQVVEALKRDCRLLCAAWMHVDGMTVADAARFFSEHAHMAPRPAQQEAQRCAFEPRTLAYTLGKLLIRKLRADVQAAELGGFDLCRFHDRFLSVGAPPVPLVREEVFGLRDGALL